MKRRSNGLGVHPVLWVVLTATVAITAVAGCTSGATPSAGPVAASAEAHGVTTPGNAGATAPTSSRSAAAAPNTGTRTSHATDSSAARTGSGAPQTTAASARRSAAPAATPPATSKVAPQTTTTPAVSPRTSTKPVATSALRPPPTTPVPPSGPGNIHETVPAVTPVTMQAAALTAPARPDAGVTVQVTDIRAVTTEARFPGEIAGPGIAVTVHITNSSSAAIDLDNAIVDVLGSDGARAVQVSGSPAAAMSGSVAPGHEASGVYVFTIPQDQRHPISIRFSYAAQTPTVLFVGNAQ